ncbi:uncharacterized protein LOC126844926 [Adelges cooleyi]|uniref:uncharacterized protein LOC126844926 n=1 Tax=Adelges cooleyi TaxID=133065 RepID=UPI00217F5859|nr:uncharacterized protein LOC126844926 [Adelges cooleyi]
MVVVNSSSSKVSDSVASSSRSMVPLSISDRGVQRDCAPMDITGCTDQASANAGSSNNEEDLEEDDEYRLYIDAVVQQFCPQLSAAVQKLAAHKIGTLNKNVLLSQFQFSSPQYKNHFGTGIDESDSKQKNRSCLDRFVMSIPCYSGEQQIKCYPSSSKQSPSIDSTCHNYCYYTEWLIVTQCSRPHRAPDVIYLKLNCRPLKSKHSSPHQNVTNSTSVVKKGRAEHEIGNQYNSISTNRSFQQYITEMMYSEEDGCNAFPSLLEWNPKDNDDCLIRLADDLYTCFWQYQLFKLCNPTMGIPQHQLKFNQVQQNHIINCRNAFAQYKRLTQPEKNSDPCYSKNNDENCDSEFGDVQVELLIPEQNDFETNDYHQQTSAQMVLLHAVVSCKQTSTVEQSGVTLIEKTPEAAQAIEPQKKKQRVLLASVSTCFPPSATTLSRNKKPMTSGMNRYMVKVLSRKLLQNPSILSEMMLDLDCLDTSMIDFASYVARVKSVVLQAYQACKESKNKEIHSSPSTDNIKRSIISIKFFDALLKEMNEKCDSSNKKELLDYYFSSDYEQTTKCQKSSSYYYDLIRFLMSSIDKSYEKDISLLKYVLTIKVEYIDKEVAPKETPLLLDFDTPDDEQNGLINKQNVMVTASVCSVYEQYEDSESDSLQCGTPLSNFDLISEDDDFSLDELNARIDDAANIIRINADRFLNSADVRRSTTYRVVDSFFPSS